MPAPLLRKQTRQHKNRFGHVLILAGSRRMLGAAALSSLAALRGGAGLVTLGVPCELNLTAQRKISPEIMTWPLPQTEEQTFSSRGLAPLRRQWKQYAAVALGPGLSTHASTRNFVHKIVAECPVPLVIDADGLNNLGARPKLLMASSTPKILTPHPGEMARLRGKKFAEDERTRREVCREFAVAYGCVVLLKGHRTVVAAPDGRHYVNRSGNVGLATAGSGDVLTGLITAICGQGIDTFAAAACGAWVHGLAGDLAAREKGKAALIASDILNAIPPALKKAARLQR
ncbi:MAG: NAD(P)H-hydrate dehydratase [Candidatus Omnitrophica bacterium]|nr:NAD(P)H-hydrate dehydratase [Candidatus Omnitrophota bacterium]